MFSFSYIKHIFVSCTWLCFILKFKGDLFSPGSSAGKESTCNAGDPRLIPGSGRSAREGIGCPLQYSCASLVAQLVKNPPAMWETWVQSLGWEDPLEKGKATHSSILPWRISWTVQSMGLQRVRHDWATLEESIFSDTSYYKNSLMHVGNDKGLR